ncbi:MAG: hypothetical protein ABFD69_01015 [Candidatus Sumerlaeia bacterium]
MLDNASAQNENDGKLQRFHNYYFTLSSVHASYSIKFRAYGPDGKCLKSVDNGIYESWWKGDFYKMRYFEDRNSVSDQDYETSFDGEMLQDYVIQGSIFSYSKKIKSHNKPQFIENPLFYNIQFLLTENGTFTGEIPMLKHSHDEFLWNSIKTRGRWVNEPSSKEAVLVVDGGKMLVKAESTRVEEFCYKIKFGTFNDGRTKYDYFPASIERTTLDSRPITLTTFQYSLSSAGVVFPRVLNLKAFSGGKVVAELDATCLEYEAGIPCPIEIFSLDSAQARVVWDADIKKPIRYPQDAVSQIMNNTAIESSVTMDKFEAPKKELKSTSHTVSKDFNQFREERVTDVPLSNSSRRLYLIIIVGFGCISAFLVFLRRRSI